MTDSLYFLSARKAIHSLLESPEEFSKELAKLPLPLLTQFFALLLPNERTYLLSKPLSKRVAKHIPPGTKLKPHSFFNAEECMRAESNKTIWKIVGGEKAFRNLPELRVTFTDLYFWDSINLNPNKLTKPIMRLSGYISGLALRWSRIDKKKSQIGCCIIFQVQTQGNGVSPDYWDVSNLQPIVRTFDVLVAGDNIRADLLDTIQQLVQGTLPELMLTNQRINTPKYLLKMFLKKTNVFQ